MPEVYPYGVQAVLSLILTAVAAFLAMCGGRSMEQLATVKLDFIRNRTWGRWVAPLFFGICVNLMALWAGTWHWYFLLFIAAMKGVTHMGHGGKTFWVKFIRRLIKPIVWCSAAILLCLATGTWMILVFQYIIGIAASLIWGLKNPKPAPIEELYIYFFMSAGMMVMVL